MDKENNKELKLQNLFLGIITIFIVCIILRYTKSIVLPFIIALFLAYIFSPITIFFKKKFKIPTVLSLVIIYILLGGIVFLFGVLIYSNIVSHSIRGQKTLRTAACVVNYSKEIKERVWYRNIKKVRSSDTWLLFKEYESLTKKAIAGGAKIISWPEYGLWVKRGDVKVLKRRSRY